MEDPGKNEAKSLIATFQDSLKKFLALPEPSEAAEPDFCSCGELMFTNENAMEIDVIYCDGIYQYVKSRRERNYIADSERVYYTPLTPVMTSKGKCPSADKKRRQEELQQIKSEYSGMTFEAFDRPIQPAAYDFCIEFDGSGKIIMAGFTGVGKTHLARATYLKLLFADRDCMWLKAPDLAELFRRIQSYNDDPADRTEAQNYYSRLTKADCVFIDDLGTERMTESDLFNEQFKLFLESIKGGLFITTNFDSAALTKRYHEKIASRILENAKAIVMTGDDYRRRSFPKGQQKLYAQTTGGKS